MSTIAPKTDFTELRRRQGVTKNATAPTAADVDTIKPSITWMDPSQRYALVNLANRDMRPKSSYPAFRVLGLFPTVEAATAFGRQVAPSVLANIYLVETCKWNLVPKSTERTPEECFSKLESLLIAYYKNVVLDKLEFDHRRSQNTSTVVEATVFQNPAYNVAVRELEKRGVSVDSVGTELNARISKGKQDLLEKFQSANESTAAAGTTAAAETAAAPQPPEGRVEFTETMLRADEDVFSALPTGQKYLLFSVMNDDDEPAFCVYGALPTLQESKGYQQFVLKLEAPTHNNNCYELGHWIYPESAHEMDRLGLATYPLDEQNRIMKWHHSNKNQAYSNMPGIDIMGDRRLDENGNIVEMEAKVVSEENAAGEEVKKEN